MQRVLIPAMNLLKAPNIGFLSNSLGVLEFVFTWSLSTTDPCEPRSVPGANDNLLVGRETASGRSRIVQTKVAGLKNVSVPPSDLTPGPRRSEKSGRVFQSWSKGTQRRNPVGQPGYQVQSKSTHSAVCAVGHKSKVPSSRSAVHATCELLAERQGSESRKNAQTNQERRRRNGNVHADVRRKRQGAPPPRGP